MSDEDDDSMSHALDITSDYIRVPSEISERIDQVISNPDGLEYQIARGNLLSIMKLGGDALSDISSLATQSQHPRMFEVLAETMKIMISAQRELMELKKIDTQINGDEGNTIEGGKSPTNVLINCTPAQLLEMMKKSKEK